MLRLNKVYLYRDTPYLIVGYKQIDDRIYYLGYQFYKNGALGKFKQLRYRNDLILQKKYAVLSPRVRVLKPEGQKSQWLSVIKAAKNNIRNLKSVESITEKEEIRLEIGRLAIASIYFQNKSSGKRYNLRDFAKGLGLTRYTSLYRYVLKFLESKFTDDKYNNAITDAADSTIIKSIRQIDEYWDGLYGFNKHIDNCLELNFQMYLTEARYRNLGIISNNH